MQRKAKQLKFLVGWGGRDGGVEQHHEWCHVVTPFLDLFSRQEDATSLYVLIRQQLPTFWVHAAKRRGGRSQ